MATSAIWKVMHRADFTRFTPIWNGKSVHWGRSSGLIVRFWVLNLRLQTETGLSRMSYSTGSHTVFYHRYHIVWITKYRYKVLQGKLRGRVRDIIRQVCREMGVQIIEGVLSSDHIHMFVSVPPHVAISDLMQRAKGRSSYKIQMEFPEIRKRYWGRRFWARGYFCTTSGNVTDDIILQYIKSHSDKPTDASR
jgi:putative transposase